MVDKPGRLAGRLRELREALNWTREVLSERSGVSASAIRDFEAGKSLPGWGTVVALAEALNADVAEFMKEPAPRDPPKLGRPKQVPLEPPAREGQPAAKVSRPRKPEAPPAPPAKKPAKKGRGKKGGTE